MKKLWFILSLVVFLFGVSACEKSPVETRDGKGGDGVLGGEENSLVGTKWKLVGFFDIENNKLTEVDSKDCEDCYTLEFETDSTVSGHAFLNQVKGVCSVKFASNEIIFKWFVPVSYAEEPDEVDKYYDAVLKSSHFEYLEDSLKLYYDNKTMYLSFKRWQ